MVTNVTAQIHDLSQTIGELRNFAAAQVVTNAHIVDELKKIADRTSTLSETGVILTQYRQTLHERFGKIHEQLGDLDEISEKMDDRLHKVEATIGTWQSNSKMLIAIVTIAASLISAIISNYGGEIVRTVVHGSATG